MFNIINKILIYFLIFLMTFMVLVVTWQIFTRFILNDPSLYSEEIAGFLLIWIGMLGSAYALSIATSGKASKIFLAGFDGYGSKDRRNKIINELFFSYSSHRKSKPIISITPTSYNFTTTSIYAIKH